MKYYDTHAHLLDELFTKKNISIDQIIENAAKANVVLINNVCVEAHEIDRLVHYSNKYSHVYFSYGIHPLAINDNWNESIMKISEFDNKKLIAIGECGLDKHYSPTASNFEIQLQVFKKQIDISISKKLPLIIHCRDAWDDLIKTLESYNGIPFGVIHCYAGNLEQAKKLINMGFYISFSTMSEYEKYNHLIEVIKGIDINKILIETDSPYLSPISVKPKLNEPCNVTFVHKFISEILNIDKVKLSEILFANSIKLFNINES